MKHIVLTGFAPFGGEDVNPSWLAIQAFQTTYQPAPHVRISTLELPVTFADCFTPLERLLRSTPADLIICIGQAGGRSAFCFEKVAINYVHARIADNAGQQPLDQAVIAGAPTAYFSSLPLGTLLTACQQAQVSATVSYSAGTFVCNALFYKLMHFIDTEQTTTAAGFIHIPYAPMQVIRNAEPCMAIEMVSRGLEACINAFLAGSPAATTAEVGTLD